MGRELKRVPLDFNWPLNKVWEGYTNPHWDFIEECPICAGTGLSARGRELHSQWYGFAPFNPSETGSTPLTPETPAVRAFAERQVSAALNGFRGSEATIVAEAVRLITMWNRQWSHHLEQADVDALVREGRLWDLTRGGTYTPTVAEVEAWNILSMGHDSFNAHICIEARCQREGVSHECDRCNGTGELLTEEVSALIDAWRPSEPPVGEGWQVWETVSEGSPISPVFATKDGIIAWLLEQRGTAKALPSGLSRSGVRRRRR